jgi:flagellar biosynthesis chaperone FliJ
MTQFVYRLARLLEQKEEAKKEAEREVTRVEQELEAQRLHLESLRRRELELNKRREEMRLKLLAPPVENGTISGLEVAIRSENLKAVGVQIEEANNDVFSQRLVVEQCEEQLQQAKKLAGEARREVEVLTKHRAKQEQRFLREQQAQEELALDEVGNALYSSRRRT